MSKIIQDVEYREDLGTNMAELRERVERMHGDQIVRLGEVSEPPGLSVGAYSKPRGITQVAQVSGNMGKVCRPFGGKPTGGVANPNMPHQPGLGVGAISSGVMGGQGNQVLAWLNSLGADTCRVWGSEPPGGRARNGCPMQKKVCGAILPYFHTTGIAATAEEYDLFAKVWFWPAFWVDTSGTEITVVALEYTSDPVFENGDGSGPLDVSTLFAPGAFYGFVPGLPAFDNTVPLTAFLANSDGAATQDYQGMFIGVSIRN